MCGSSTCRVCGSTSRVSTKEFSADAFEEGLGFDGSSIRGFQEIQESDMLLMPDPDTRVPRSVHGGADAGADLQRQGSGDRRVVHARSAAHRDEGGAVPEVDRDRRHRVFRPGGRILHFRRRPIQPGLRPRLLLHRLQGRILESGQGREAQSRLQAALQGRLLPGAADGPAPGHPHRDDAHPRTGRASHVEVHHHEVGDGGSVRDRHAVRFAAQDGGQPAEVQVRHQAGGAAAQQDGHVDAQADLPGQRLGHARAPESVEGRARTCSSRRASTPI